MVRCKCHVRGIFSFPVFHKDNNGVYNAVPQMRELRQTVGCVYQYQRHSPRLHINGRLTLHLYVHGFGEWPVHFFFFLHATSSPTSYPLCLFFSFLSFTLSFLLLPFIFHPLFLACPLSAPCQGVTVFLSLCVCVSSLSL